MNDSTSSSSAPAAPPWRPRKALIAGLVVTLGLIALDLGSKAWVMENLSREITSPPPTCQADDRGYVGMQRARSLPIVVVDGFFELRYAENCGAAFGFLREAPPILKKGIFYLAATGAMVVLSWMFVVGRGGKPFAFAAPLIVSGAFGNLVDRIRLGYVVDFLRFFGESPAWFVEHFGISGNWEYPTFNVADITITVGVVLLLIDGFQEAAAERRAAKAAAGSAAKA